MLRLRFEFGKNSEDSVGLVCPSLTRAVGWGNSGIFLDCSYSMSFVLLPAGDASPPYYLRQLGPNLVVPVQGPASGMEAWAGLWKRAREGKKGYDTFQDVKLISGESFGMFTSHSSLLLPTS